jgi:hypothetical protein
MFGDTVGFAPHDTTHTGALLVVERFAFDAANRLAAPFDACPCCHFRPPRVAASAASAMANMTMARTGSGVRTIVVRHICARAHVFLARVSARSSHSEGFCLSSWQFCLGLARRGAAPRFQRGLHASPLFARRSTARFASFEKPTRGGAGMPFGCWWHRGEEAENHHAGAGRAPWARTCLTMASMTWICGPLLVAKALSV